MKTMLEVLEDVCSGNSPHKWNPAGVLDAITEWQAPRGEAVAWARVADDRNTVVSLYAIGDVPVNDDDLFVNQSELRPLVFGDTPPVAAVVSDAMVERFVKSLEQTCDFSFGTRNFQSFEAVGVNDLRTALTAALTAARGGA